MTEAYAIELVKCLVLCALRVEQGIPRIGIQSHAGS